MDIGEIADRHAKRIALAGGVFILGVAGYAVYHDSSTWAVIFVGVGAYGFFRLVSYIFLVLTGGIKPEDKANEVTQPMPPMQGGRSDAPEETAPQTPADNTFYFRFNGSRIPVPQTVNRKHLGMVTQARAKGQLTEVTENKLNTIGISRFALPPNAKTLMEFLNWVGAIDKNGKWTEAGELNFPSPGVPNGRHRVVSPRDGHHTTQFDTAPQEG